MKKYLPEQTGYSLIEVVVLIVVAAIVLPAIIIPFTEGTRDMDKPNKLATMAFLGQGQMEKNTFCAFTQIQSWSTFSIQSLDDYSSTGVVKFVEEGNFTTETTVELWKSLTVTIQHADIPDLELTTVIYRGGR